MKKHLFGQLRFERNFYCDIFLVETGELSLICTVPLTLFSKAVDITENILLSLTERYGRIRVRPSRFDDIPKRLRRFFVSMDNDDYFELFATNYLYLEAENVEETV